MTGRMGTDGRFLETLFSAGSTCGLSDAQLLERFVARQDETAEAAFESLVLRHGPMVFGISLKILGNTHDAQDAFQATLLILATRARSIMRRGSVASWLYGVALRVARRARSDAARRLAQERRIAEMTRSDVDHSNPEDGDDIEVLHEELERLPRKYREAVVLCYLEGMSLEAASAQLGCPIGTVGVRLMRARERLKTRLSRRGMAVPAGLLIAGTATQSAWAAVPAALVRSTVHAAMHEAASGIVPLAAAKLTTDVLRTMIMIKLAKTFTGVIVFLAALASFGGILVHSGRLVAREPRNERTTQAPDSWIGRQVITKYSAGVRVDNQKGDPQTIFRVYTVQEREGTQIRLVSGKVSGRIEATEVILLDEAIDFYSQEARTKPQIAAPFRQRALIWNFKGQRDKAIADFTEAIRLEPDDAFSYANRAISFLLKHENDKAIADYSEAVRIDTRDAISFNGRGLAWFNKKDFDKAIADFSEAIRLDPKFAAAYDNRGNAWNSKREYEKAIADCSEAIRIDPQFLWAYFNRGSAWSDKQEYDKAIADYTEFIRIDPRTPFGFNSRGGAWSLKHEYDQAIADYTEAIRLNPQSAISFSERALAWSSKHEYDKAIADYTEVIRLDPQNALAFNSRAFASSAKNEYDKAIADYTEAVRLSPQNVFALGGRAFAWSSKHEHEKAIADYTEVIRLDPQNALAYTSRGGEWSLKHEYDKAIEDYDDAIKIDPRNALAFKSRGFSRWLKLEYAKALADFSEAIRIEPASANAYNARALIWASCPDVEHRDGKKAVESATTACELTKWNDATYLETLAAACASVGDFESAAKWQAKANALYADEEEKARGEEQLRLYQEQNKLCDVAGDR